MEVRSWRPLAALLVVVGMCLPMTAMAEYSGTVRDFVLFDGRARDSTEHASPWIPIKNAMRIVIRTWSTHAAFTGVGSGDPDSTTSDSIATFRVLFSDSVLFMASDSLGTIVTARSTIPRTVGVHGEPFPMCADSIMYSGASYNDSLVTHSIGRSFPVNQVLRAPVTGSGRLGAIFNVIPGGVSACGDCTMIKNYMRVRIVPLRRHIWPTGANTCDGAFCNRVNGLKGLRMVATVYYRQH